MKACGICVRLSERKEVTHECIGGAKGPGQKSTDSSGQVAGRRRPGQRSESRGQAVGGGDPGSAGRPADAERGSHGAGPVGDTLLPDGEPSTAWLVGRL